MVLKLIAFRASAYTKFEWHDKALQYPHKTDKEDKCTSSDLYTTIIKQ
jgi:hypothetical protein